MQQAIAGVNETEKIMKRCPSSLSCLPTVLCAMVAKISWIEWWCITCVPNLF